MDEEESEESEESIESEEEEERDRFPDLARVRARASSTAFTCCIANEIAASFCSSEVECVPLDPDESAMAVLLMATFRILFLSFVPVIAIAAAALSAFENSTNANR